MKTTTTFCKLHLLILVTLALTPLIGVAQPHEPCNCVCPSITPIQGQGSDYLGSSASGVLPCPTDIQHIYELHDGCTNLYIAITNCNHRSFSEVKLRINNWQCVPYPVKVYDNTDPAEPDLIATIPAYNDQVSPYPEIIIPIDPALLPCATLVIPLRVCGLKFGVGSLCRDCGLDFGITIEHPNPANPAEDAPCRIPFRINFTGTPAGLPTILLPRLLSVVPNPARDVVRVDLDHPITTSVATIYRMDGSIAYRKDIAATESASSSVSIGVNDLPCGAYLLEIAEGAMKSTGIFTVHK